MKLVIEVRDGSNVEVHKYVTANGMKFCLDWFAKGEMQDTVQNQRKSNMLEYIGEEAICVNCGEFRIITKLDEDDLPICYVCAVSS
jgi:hypothetical protein